VGLAGDSSSGVGISIVFDLFGRKGMGVEGRLERKEDAADSIAIKDACTTSSWMPTPQTCWFDSAVVHSMNVAALTLLPSPRTWLCTVIACSL